MSSLFGSSFCYFHSFCVDFDGSVVGNRGATVKAREKLQSLLGNVAASKAEHKVTDAKEDGHYQGRYIEG